ncbi:putative cytoplasmic protein [Escherichia coli]|uniref:2-oxoadipate dioxygenase/decarboxylase n=1 Tax=Escherichia coli TaxID=562 RepID=A0A376VKW7_ECOLX|nr:putative cytoplasmic protein [Escherichia coli]
MANSITADEIREQFSQAMSAMYQQEVPQYGTLLELVADVNLTVLENNPQLHEKMVNADELARLNVERHGGNSRWDCTRACYSSADVCHYGDVPGELLRSLAGGSAGTFHSISAH